MSLALAVISWLQNFIEVLVIARNSYHRCVIVQYENGGMYVLHWCDFSISVNRILNPELADTPPAIAMSLIWVFSRFFYFLHQNIDDTRWIEAQISASFFNELSILFGFLLNEIEYTCLTTKAKVKSVDFGYAKVKAFGFIFSVFIN